jgi:colanic acid/amylovoran biosynthesis protein
MRILIEPSDFTYGNVGDLAMLQVAYSRLRALWPEAHIQILTADPDALALFCPAAEPIDIIGRQSLLGEGYLFGPSFKRLPTQLLAWLRNFEQYLRRRWPQITRRLLRLKMMTKGTDTQAVQEFLATIADADLVVVSGMGGITDAFPEFASELLDVLDSAIHYKKTVVMFGQGIGPLDNQDLLVRARSVLPHVNFIALRESRAGIALLERLGVRRENIITTGDDAISLSHSSYIDNLGPGIGINIRSSSYSNIDSEIIYKIRATIQATAKRYRAPLVPVPISHKDKGSDDAAIRSITHGYDSILNADEELDTPLKVIEQIQNCRIVITGSYHAAVFALAQGLPTVALARSRYYVDKFLGLAEQFGGGGGCQVVLVDDTKMPEQLATAIEEAWTIADQVRPKLLEAAKHQMKLSELAYRRVYEMLELDAGKKPTFFAGLMGKTSN